MRRRIVKAGNKDNKEIYRKIAEKREINQREKTKMTIIDRIEQLYDKAIQMGRQGTEKQKKEFTKNMDVTMKAVVEELLTIEDRQQTESNQTKEKTYKGGNKKRHLWSDVMAKKTKIHKMLIALLKQSRKKEKRKHCVDTIQQIRRTDQISDDIMMEITPLPQTQRNDVWNKYQNKVIFDKMILYFLNVFLSTHCH